MFDNKHQTCNTQEMQNLKVLLEDSSIVKVLYDAGATAAALLHWEGLAICNVFDIQVTSPPSSENVCVQLCLYTNLAWLLQLTYGVRQVLYDSFWLYAHVPFPTGSTTLIR